MTLPLNSGGSPSPPLPTTGWPWGQIAILLFGLGMALSFLNDASRHLTGREVDAIVGFAGLLVLTGGGLGIFALWKAWRLRSIGHRLPRLKRLTQVNRGVWGLVLVLTTLSVLVPGFRATSSASRQGRPGPPSGRLRVISSPNGAIALKVPEEWTDYPRELLASHAFGAIDPTQQMGVAVFVEDRRNLDAKSAQEYATLVSSRFSRDFDKVELLEATMSSRPGDPELQEYVDATIDGERLRFLLAYVVRPSLFIQLRAWAPPSVFEQNEVQLAEILRSVHYLGDDAAIRGAGPAAGQSL